jgi:hypothetical protein
VEEIQTNPLLKTDERQNKMGITDAELDALLDGTPLNFPTDEQVLTDNTHVPASGTSVGTKSQTAEELYAAGEKYRQEQTSGSMPPELFSQSGEPELPTTPSRSPRMHPELISSPRLLSDDDLRQLADSKTFPIALAGGYQTGSSDPVNRGPIQKYKDDFLAMDDPFKREQYLRNLRDSALSHHADEDLYDDIASYELVDGYPLASVAGGLGVGVLGGAIAATAGPALIAAAASGLGPFIAYVGEVSVALGVPLFKLAGGTAFAKLAYDKIMNDPQMTEEEAQKIIKEEVEKALKKQMKGTQKDTGSPAVTDVSAN